MTENKEIDADVICAIRKPYLDEIDKLKLQLNAADEKINVLSSTNIELGKQLDEEKKLNADIKQRYVEIPNDKCTDCQSLYDGYCNGESKKVDLVSLIDSGATNKLLQQKDQEIEQLKAKIKSYEDFENDNLKGI